MKHVEELIPEALFDLDEIEALPSFDVPTFHTFTEAETSSATACTYSVTVVSENPYDGVLCFAQSPFGLWAWDADYIQLGLGSLVGLGPQGSFGSSWGGFAEGWSRGGQGVINSFSGGLFNRDYGLYGSKTPFNVFTRWEDVGYESNECNGGYKFGTWMGRGAEAALLAAGALEAAGIESRIAYHSTPHPFGSLGELSHLQLNTWQAGVKASGWVFRIPLPW